MRLTNSVKRSNRLPKLHMQDEKSAISLGAHSSAHKQSDQSKKRRGEEQKPLVSFSSIHFSTMRKIEGQKWSKKTRYATLFIIETLLNCVEHRQIESI